MKATYVSRPLILNTKDNKVLKNINIEIKKGEVTAFVGASGAGKRLMALILKFITPNNGNILLMIRI